MVFSWLSFAIALLKLVNSIISYFHDRGLIDEGRRQVIAENALNIATKVKSRDEIRKQVDAMSEEEVDRGLADLVDPPAGGRKS